MAKTNYHQIRRQKETARKARQQENLARRQARVAGTTDADPAAPPADPPPTDPKEAP